MQAKAHSAQGELIMKVKTNVKAGGGLCIDIDVDLSIQLGGKCGKGSDCHNPCSNPCK
jgi:hypothetical protein